MDFVEMPPSSGGLDLFGGFHQGIESRGPKYGVLERADGGTVVLGNILKLGSLDQVTLAATLQTGEYCRFPLDRMAKAGRLHPSYLTDESRHLFTDEMVKTDVRLIATTTCNLADLVASGDFDAELYSCFNALTVYVPLLRERKEDIPALVDHYLPLAAAGLGLPRKKVAPELLEFFVSYPWPGNIRELQALLELSLLHSKGDTVRMTDLPPELTARWTTFLQR
jgi:DNA-binding NtrC family response regulator